MFGYSYSGFNSLQLACERPPALGAICAIYATDDRYTDDVHYMGGALRAIDLVDYCHYMVPMNALPPVPRCGATGGATSGWRGSPSTSRGCCLDGATTRRPVLAARLGAARLRTRIECPTMIVAGWADGYRNNTFRTFEQLRVREGAADRAVEPHVAGDVAARDRTSISCPEMIRFFGRWLRDDAPSSPRRRSGCSCAMRPSPSPTWPMHRRRVAIRGRVAAARG